MARVEWTRHSGEDVETLVGILLCRRYPHAVRVRPSRGDGGLDVLVPEPDGIHDYQVKKFAENLDSNQKRNIVESLAAAVQTHESGKTMLSAWHLTLPLNHTPENRTWFQQITENSPFACSWKGFDFVEGLAAEFPEVIDYYIGNGRERLEETTRQWLSVLGSGRAVDNSRSSGLEIRDVTPQLADIYRALNQHDPHFRYEFSVTESLERPTPPDVVFYLPGLHYGTGAVCLHRRVYPLRRSAEGPPDTSAVHSAR